MDLGNFRQKTGQEQEIEKEKREQEGGKEKESHGKNHDQKRVRLFPLVSKYIKAVCIPVHGCTMFVYTYGSCTKLVQGCAISL